MPAPKAGGMVPESDLDPNSVIRLALVYYRDKNYPLDNMYAHPLDFNVLVDIHNNKVLKIFDSNQEKDMSVLPNENRNFDPEYIKNHYPRNDVKPLVVM